MQKIITAIAEAEKTKATVACALSLVTPDVSVMGSLLLPLTRNNPDIKVMIGIPWWEAPINITDIVNCKINEDDPPKWLNRALAAIGAKIPLCGAIEELSEDYVADTMRDALGEAIDDRILTGSGTDGMMGIIGGSTSVAVKNATAGIVTLADVDVLIAALRPRFQPDCVLGFNNQTWAALKAEVKASYCCGRIDEAAQTLDGRRVILSGAIDSGKAAAFNPSKYLTAGGQASVSACTPCGEIGRVLPAWVKMAGGLSGVPLAGHASGAYLDGTAA